MTIVAGFGINDCGFIVGDIMLSGNEIPERILRIPTLGYRTKIFPIGSGFVPLGLCQKISILSPNLAVGWSGSKLYASMAFKHLINFTEQSSESPKVDDVRKCIDSFFRDEPRSRDELHLYCLIAESDRIGSLVYGGAYFDSAILGRVNLLGSGTDDIFKYLNDFDAPTNLENTDMAVLRLVSELMLREVHNGQNILHYYGGGYELVGYLNNRFEKLDDVTYAFWDADYKGENKRLGLRRLIKVTYQNDLLLLQVASLENNEPTSVGLYVVPPVHRTVSKNELERLT